MEKQENLGVEARRRKRVTGLNVELRGKDGLSATGEKRWERAVREDGITGWTTTDNREKADKCGR